MAKLTGTNGIGKMLSAWIIFEIVIVYTLFACLAVGIFCGMTWASVNLVKCILDEYGILLGIGTILILITAWGFMIMAAGAFIIGGNFLYPTLWGL